MNFQEFVDCVKMPCAVLSVENRGNGQWGEIRIVCSNQIYKDTMGPAYYDGMLYQELVAKDLKFEDYCYRAACLHQKMHAYVETVEDLGFWTDQQMTPLEGGDERIGYCQFTFEFTKSAEAERMVPVSVDVAAMVVKCCIKLLGGGDFKESVESVVSYILEASEGFNCRIMLVDEKKKEAINFCEKMRPVEEFVFKNPDGQAILDKTAPPDGKISYEIVQSWKEMIGVSNGVIVKNEFEMDDLERRNPEWVRSMRSYGVTSLVMIPMRRAKHVIGYLYVVNFNVDKVVEIKEFMELMSFILGSEISNYLLVQKLERMSRIDGLTGLQNRHALVERLEQIVNDKVTYTLGLVNMDLNGLKEVNDERGHDAGDELLIYSANVMKKVFSENTLYRIGGDEFIGLVMGDTKDEFDARVRYLRTLEKTDPRFNIAIGAFWAKDRLPDINTAFLNADQSMYQDKKEYYRLHPEKNRRVTK